jgi:uncharacterized OB-fold protein
MPRYRPDPDRSKRLAPAPQPGGGAINWQCETCGAKSAKPSRYAPHCPKCQWPMRPAGEP